MVSAVREVVVAAWSSELRVPLGAYVSLVCAPNPTTSCAAFVPRCQVKIGATYEIEVSYNR